ncbi:processed acidic surface protein [Bacillus mesophilus]|uniref:Processed acidic surface protein n=1 Tax=Bacillus mesophilus TaxID=1808955 RepID=A0A6M0Q4J3_9BACI|nr:processed acidic surface protein [Bacillus mesophilus]MBM7659850.1 processed acidic surface protein [Bacillus mesophilus]NEY70709.1 processed acidic surface protein [Bacillus mesophilus]
MKTTACVFILSTILMIPVFTQAAVFDQEMETYLSQLGRTQDDLEEYLSFLHLIFEDVQKEEELREEDGTLINETNIKTLLDNYKLTQQDLDELLHQVGEQVEEYTFIEDLNKAVSYYIEHAEDLAGLANFFSYIGLSDDEVSRLYQHVTSLEQQSLYEKLMEVNKQINETQPVEEPITLTTEQKHELFPLLNEVLSIYQLVPTYHIHPQALEPSSRKELSSQQLQGKGVKIELYDQVGTFIGDMNLTSEMLSSDFITQTSQQLLRIGQTKRSIQQLQFEGDPITQSQSPYIASLFYGSILLLGSTVCYLFSMNRMKR